MPNAKGEYYLGLDLSLSSPGYAVIKVRDRQAHLIEKGYVKTNAKKPHGYRLKQIENVLTELWEKHEYKAVIRERGFSRFPSTTQTLFKVVGLSDVVFADYGNIHEIPPTTVKKTVTGDGKASKADVEKAVRRILKLHNNTKFATDDESDACAVCLAYLIKNKLIEKEECI